MTLAIKQSLATQKAKETHKVSERSPQKNSGYATFEQIDGSHPWQTEMPNSYVLYPVRILRDSKITFFNFALAKEMGLIPEDHPEKLNKKLSKKIVQTFALRIINEYDTKHGLTYPARDIKPNLYMATRYLQLQHKCKRGTTSGDGRGIWNGVFRARGKSWDISSCGTGATCLSPAAVESKHPIRTGDKKVCYGNGLADVDEGLSAAILSEIFHQKGIDTERTLVVLETPNKSAINVRVASCLLRPSHFFVPLRQNRQLELKNALDLFIDRQLSNCQFPPFPKDSLKYEVTLKLLAQRYGRFVARLEREYIFCWLAWDGDNMLMNGGIIDYGSIRQFGVFHHRYRYDDVDRFSTTITEQKREARNLIQVFAQMMDYARTGKKYSQSKYGSHWALGIFDRAYQAEYDYLLLRSFGFSTKQADQIMHSCPNGIRKLKASLHYFERALLPGGSRAVPDGINQPALYDIRPIFKKLAQRILKDTHEISSEEFFKWIATDVALRRIKSPSPLFRKYCEILVRSFRELCQSLGKDSKKILLECSMRGSLQNDLVRLTGDGAVNLVESLMKARRTINAAEFQKLLTHLIRDFSGSDISVIKLKGKTAKIRERALDLVESYKHSL